MESEFGHYHFELVFELLVLLCVFLEISLEYRVRKHLIPTHPLLLRNLQTARNEVLGLRLEVFVDLQRLGLDVLDQLEFSMCSPRCFVVYHLIEDEPDRPNIAFRGIRLRFQYLQRHVERCAYRSCVFDPLSDVLFGKAKIADFDHALAEHDIGRFEIAC